MTRRKSDRWAMRLYVGMFVINSILSIYAVHMINEYSEVMGKILIIFKNMIMARNV